MDVLTENVSIITVPSHISELSKSLHCLQQNDTLCDVLILGEDGDIKAHSVVLSAVSPVFRQWISNSERINGFISVYLTGEMIQDLLNLITFIYTGSLSISSSNIHRMIKLLQTVNMKFAVKYLYENVFPFDKRFSELCSYVGTKKRSVIGSFDTDDYGLVNENKYDGNDRVNSYSKENIQTTFVPIYSQSSFENSSQTNGESLLPQGMNSEQVSKTCTVSTDNQELTVKFNNSSESDTDGVNNFDDQSDHETEPFIRQKDLKHTDGDKNFSCAENNESLEPSHCYKQTVDKTDHGTLSCNSSDETEQEEERSKDEMSTKIPTTHCRNEKQTDVENVDDKETKRCKICDISFDNQEDYKFHYKERHEISNSNVVRQCRKRKNDSDHVVKQEETFSPGNTRVTRGNARNSGKNCDKNNGHNLRKRTKVLTKDNVKLKITKPNNKKEGLIQIKKENVKTEVTGTDRPCDEKAMKSSANSTYDREKEEHKSIRQSVRKRQKTEKIENSYNVDKNTSESNEKKKAARTLCILCKTRFIDHETYLNHRRDMHANIHHEMNERKTTHTCSYEGCGYKTKNKGFMARHKDLIHGEEVDETKINVFRCEVEGCNYYHVQKSRIIVHMKDHSQTVSVICDICGKGFKHKKALIVHKKSHIPLEERNYKYSCPICGKRFYIKGSLTTHLKLHQDHKYLCHLCPYSSNALSRRHLDIHLFKVHQIPLPDNRQIYRCTQCDYYTFYKGVYDSHLSKHSGEKFDCDLCGKSFGSQMNLRQHVRRHKAEKIKCPYDGCTYFGRKEDMRDHTQSMHTYKNTKPFTCHLCEYRCNLQGNLTKHLRGKHKVDVETTSTLWRKLMETGQGYDAIFDQNRTFAMEKVERTPVDHKKDFTIGEGLPSIGEIVSMVSDSFVTTNQLHVE